MTPEDIRLAAIHIARDQLGPSPAKALVKYADELERFVQGGVDIAPAEPSGFATGVPEADERSWGQAINAHLGDLHAAASQQSSNAGAYDLNVVCQNYHASLDSRLRNAKAILAFTIRSLEPGDRRDALMAEVESLCERISAYAAEPASDHRVITDPETGGVRYV